MDPADGCQRDRRPPDAERAEIIVILGIDNGTTKAAAAVIDPGGKVLAEASVTHRADLPRREGRAEQDVRSLLDAAVQAVARLPLELRRRVAAVGVTGQMHGVLLTDEAGEAITPLITWQDRRVLAGDFLDELNARVDGVLRAGFGCATLAWLAAGGELPPKAVSAATIADHLVARLVGQARAATDLTHAASWGLVDLETGDWDHSAVEKAGVPIRLLPRVLPCGAEAGTTRGPLADAMGIPLGIRVAVAIGDNQASLLATLDDPERELALTLGTGGQLSAVLPPGSRPPRPGLADPWELRPFPGGRLAVVAAALCGGVAWAWLVDTAGRWMEDLGLAPPSRDELFARLNELAQRAPGTLNVRPTFLGERHAPSRRGRINGIDLESFSLGNLARSLGRGLAANLKTMLPPEVLAGRVRIVGSGNGLRRNPMLRKCVEEVFGIPVDLTSGREEAAVGAALNARA